MSRSPEEVERLMNLLDTVAYPDARILCMFVPTRNVRVVVLDKEEKKFQVEQLEVRAETWHPLSLHEGDDPWESYISACRAATEAQQIVIQRIRKMKMQNDIAMRKAKEEIERTRVETA